MWALGKSFEYTTLNSGNFEYKQLIAQGEQKRVDFYQLEWPTHSSEIKLQAVRKFTFKLNNTGTTNILEVSLGFHTKPMPLGSCC